MDFAAEASTTITSARARRASAGRRQSQAGIQRTGRTSPHRTSLAPQRWIPHGGSGQVYVVSAGKVYHPAWCNSVGNVWDENPKRLLVFEENTVGTRKACDEPFSPERQLYAVELLLAGGFAVFPGLVPSIQGADLRCAGCCFGRRCADVRSLGGRLSVQCRIYSMFPGGSLGRRIVSGTRVGTNSPFLERRWISSKVWPSSRAFTRSSGSK